jgi:phosphoribosylcarboxyaminoimidazole (NCAIR) mutase
MFEYAHSAKERGLKVIIAGAGLAAGEQPVAVGALAGQIFDQRYCW